MNEEEAWLEFKALHPKMLEETLGPAIMKAFNILRSRFNATAVQNYETLTELFTKKAFLAGWKARDDQSLTKVITNSEAMQP